MSALFSTFGYRLAFLPLTDDGDFEFLTRHVPYAEYALRAFPKHETAPSVWRFDGDCWESEELYTRNGEKGRYSVMWWDE